MPHFNPLPSYLFIMLMLIGMHCQAQRMTHPDYQGSTINPVKVGGVAGGIIKISGKVVVRGSEKPIPYASVIVKSGKHVLAHKQADKNGNFALFVPPEKVSDQSLTVKIKYKNHIFSKQELKAISQKLHVSINGALLIKKEPISDYALSYHSLSDPQTGSVMVHYSTYRVDERLNTKADEIDL